MLWLSAIGLSLTGCSLFEDQTLPDIDEADAEDSLLMGKGSYVTAVDFNEGYDWRKDPLFGQGPGRIVLLKDGQEIFSVDAGSGTDVSTDPDLHQLIGGHLYTEYYDGIRTVIRRDGLQFREFDGHEVLRGVCIGRKTYTLWQRIPDRGLVLREDWDSAVFERSAGEIAGDGLDEEGALYEDAGHVCFAYFKGKDWFVVKDGVESQLDLPDGTETVYDVRCIGGNVCAAVCLSDGSAPVLLKGGRKYDLSKSLQRRTTHTDDYRLYSSDGTPGLVGSYKLRGDSGVYTGFWTVNGLSGYKKGDCRCCKDASSYLVRSGGEVTGYVSVNGSGNFDSGYTLVSRDCVTWTGDGIKAALTGWRDGRKCALFDGWMLKDIDINGYLTSITIIK